jgi:hypothetical protein
LLFHGGRTISIEEAPVDQKEPVDQTGRTGDPSRQMRWGWRRWATWGNLGLLLAAAVLPFGWLLPAARLAGARMRMRRGRD